MKDHMAAVHEGKKNYSCESCQMTFGFLSNKKTHQKLGRCPGKLVEKTNNDLKNVDEFMVRKFFELLFKIETSCLLGS
jgi:transcription initiation factor IIE alpha subunit